MTLTILMVVHDGVGSLFGHTVECHTSLMVTVHKVSCCDEVGDLAIMHTMCVRSFNGASIKF